MNWIAQSFIAMASFALMSILITSQTKNGVSSQFSMLIVSIVWLPSFGIWAWRKGLDFPISFNTVAVIVIAAVLSVVGNWAQFEAQAKAPNAGMAMAVVSCQVVLITILAKIIFGGELPPMKIAGIGMCIAGIIAIVK